MDTIDKRLSRLVMDMSKVRFGTGYRQCKYVNFLDDHNFIILLLGNTGELREMRAECLAMKKARLLASGLLSIALSEQLDELKTNYSYYYSDLVSRYK